MIGKLFPRRLNKDAEPSLIKPDEMLDALNVLVTGDEGADAGRIKRAHGNFEIFKNDPDVAFNNFPGVSNEIVVGYVADESSNRIYYFASSDQSNSIYLMQKFSEDEVSLTLLLRDTDLGFDDFVVADVIKTPKRELQSSTQDPDVSGESGDETDIFDFDSDDTTTDIVENQTIIIVSTPPSLGEGTQYYNFGVDTEDDFTPNTIGFTNLGGEPGTITLTISDTTDVNFSEYVSTTFNTTGSQTIDVTVPGGGTVFVNYTTTLSGAPGVTELDFIGGSIVADYQILVEQEETPFVAPGNLLNQEFNVPLEYLPFQLNLPKYVSVIPTAIGPGAVDQNGTNPPGNAYIANIVIPESVPFQALATIEVRVELFEDINLPEFNLPEMFLKAEFLDGSNSITLPSGFVATHGFGALTTGTSSTISVPLTVDDFQANVGSIDGGSVASVSFNLNKTWDSSTLSGDELVRGSCRFKVVDENGNVFDQGTAGISDDAYSDLEFEYEVQDIPIPAKVEGGSSFSRGIVPRVYRVQDQGYDGGGAFFETFSVTNVGELDGFFHIGIDPFGEFVENFMNSFNNTSGQGGGDQPNTWADLNEVTLNWFESLYNSIQVTIGQGNAIYKPTFYKNTSGNVGKFAYFDSPTGAELSFHHNEAGVQWFPLAAGASINVTINFSNTNQAVYPVLPFSLPIYDETEFDFDPRVHVTYPIAGHYAPFEYLVGQGEFQKPIIKKDDLINYVYQDEVGDSALEQKIPGQIMASAFLQNAVSEILIFTTPELSGAAWNNSFVSQEGNTMTITSGEIKPEILIMSAGYHANPSARAASVIPAVNAQSAPVPLYTTYAKPNPAETQPTTVSENVSQCDDSGIYGRNNKNNIFREFGDTPQSSDNIVNQYPEILTLDYPREEGEPMGFFLFSVSTVADETGPEIGLRAIVEQSNNSDFNTNSSSHNGQVYPGVGFFPDRITGGSIGTAYVGIINTVMEAEGSLGSVVTLGDNLEFVQNLIVADGQSADTSAGARAEFRGFLNTMNADQFGTFDTFNQNLFYYASGFNDANGYTTNPDLGLAQGGNENFGNIARDTFNLPLGGYGYFESTHGLSWNFSTQGQFDPSLNIDTYEGADGYRVLHQVIDLNDNYYNPPQPGGYGTFAKEVVHMRPDTFTYYVTGIPPGDQDGNTIVTSPPPPTTGERGSLFGQDPAPTAPPEVRDSNNQRVVNLQKSSASKSLKKQKEATRRGVSSKKRRRY